MRYLLISSIALAVFAGCGAAAPQPDDMSAAAHRREAERQRQQAREAANASRRERASDQATAVDSTFQRGPWYEPHPEAVKQAGSPELYAAEQYARHAHEHERAAAELERFEEAECAGIPSATRAACPLLHDVLEIIDVPGGVRIEFADRVPVERVVGQIRCHLAYARTRAFAEVEDCPLYTRGVRAAVARPHAVELSADDRATVHHIRDLARAQALPAPADAAH